MIFGLPLLDLATNLKCTPLELLTNSGKSARAIERDLGITIGLLLKWRDGYQVKQGNGAAHLEASGIEAAQAEIRRLKRRLNIAEQERDILKKAISIFSQKDE